MISRIALLLGLCLMSAYSMAEPLGIRTNNPGNIIKTEITWKGEVPCEESRFECFDTEYHGIRALALNLLNYQRRYELRTVEEIIHRWSPPSENRTDLLVEVVGDRLGIQKDRELDLESPLILRELMVAIIIQENGYNPYEDKLIREITNGLTNSNGNHDDDRRGLARRGDEAVGDEAADMARTAEDDVGGPQQGTDREGADQTEHESTLPVDSEGDCADMCICSNPSTQVSSRDRPRSPGHYRVDRVGPGLPLLRGLRINSLAHSGGPDPNPPRHPRRELNCGIIFRGFDNRTPII